MFVPKNTKKMNSREKDIMLEKQVETVIGPICRSEEFCVLVTVDDGWVQLDGKVNSEADREFIGRLADHVFGVSRVLNYLTCNYRSAKRQQKFLDEAKHSGTVQLR